MDKNIEVGLLMDFYGELLTDRQKDIMDLYYNDNLSLSEIAEGLEISKQGVQDNIKRAEKSLYEVEEKLGLLERFENHSEKINSAINILKEVKKTCKDDRLSEIVDILNELLND